VVTPKPAIFDPANAPPGVQLKFISFWQQRDMITPRLLLVHTNAASKEGSIDAAYNWANQEGSNHTIPHYQVDRQDNGSGFIARKMLPTNRKGIANQTAPSVEGFSTYGSVQKFSLAIETADLGYPTPGATEGFTPAQAEMIARIIAYESIVWKFPIALPDSWHGTGVASHTDPYGYPFWTIAQGKVCPGDAKKKQVREQIIPRANAIKAEWTAPAPAPKPPAPDDEGLSMTFSGMWKMPNSTVYAVYLAKGSPLGYKIWLKDTATRTAFVNLCKVNGWPSDVNICEDADMFRAFGPVIGPNAVGFDEWGVHL